MSKTKFLFFNNLFLTGGDNMALFPFFMDISGKRGLIIGGGKHAWEKIERLRPYAPKLQVIAETFLPEIEAVACEKSACENMIDKQIKQTNI